MTNHQSGHDAEKQAAQYLETRGFSVRELNWKTRYCEIDIVAERANTIWFVEVKSRKTTHQGFGYEYITTKKLKQMTFAAEMWVVQHNWPGPYQLGVLSIDGSELTFIEDV